MACKINSIEQRYRETNPTLADKLTDIAMNAWQSIKDSELFQKEGLSYVFNAPNTKKRIEQDKVVDTINATQPTPFVKEKEGKVSVNALLLHNETTSTNSTGGYQYDISTTFSSEKTTNRIFSDKEGSIYPVHMVEVRSHLLPTIQQIPGGYSLEDNWRGLIGGVDSEKHEIWGTALLTSRLLTPSDDFTSKLFNSKPGNTIGRIYISKNVPFLSADSEGININPKGFSDFAKEFSTFEEYKNGIEAALSEEAIHFTILNLTPDNWIDDIYKNLSKSKIEKIKQIYKFTATGKELEHQIAHEYIRMCIQQKHLGNITEKSTRIQLRDIIKKFIKHITTLFSKEGTAKLVIDRFDTFLEKGDVIPYTDEQLYKDMQASIVSKGEELLRKAKQLYASVDAKFLPFQASLTIQEKYGKEVTQEQLQTDSDIVFHQSFINKEGIPVGIYTYKDETNPKFNILGNSIDEALAKLKRDGINNNRLNEPELREGQFRLYRAEDHTGNSSIPDWLKTQPEYDGINDAAGRWFYRTKEEAEYHARTFGGKLMYVDIPTNTVEQYNARDNKFVGGYGKAGKEYFVTKEIGERRKPLPTLDENTVAPIENEPIPNQPRLAHNIEQMLDDLATRFQVNWGYDYEMAQRGAIRDGKVLINPNHATFDTPFHEYLHPFINLIKQQGSPFYQLLSNSVMSVTDITGKSVLFETKKNNPNLVGDELIEEAIVEAAGLAAIGRLVETSANKSFLDYLRMFLDNIGKLLGFDFEQNVDLNTPFRTVVNMMLDSNFVYDMRPYANNANQRLTRDEIRNVLNQLNEDIVTEYESSVNEQGIDEQIRKQRNIRTGDIYTGVHEDIVQPYYDKIFKDPIDPTPSMVFQKEAGTVLHNVFEDVLYTTYVDPITNRLRPEVLAYYSNPTEENWNIFQSFFTEALGNKEHEDVYSEEDPDLVIMEKQNTPYYYNEIHNYLSAIVSDAYKTHGPTVEFRAEQRLLDTDKGRAGTTDLLILGPEKFDIYDWKTINPSKYNSFSGERTELELLAPFKETAYKLQMREYIRMVKKLTGLELNKAKAIPIATDINKNSNGYYLLGGIMFGDVRMKKIGVSAVTGEEQRYLLPIMIEGETPENKIINEFINKLEGYIKVYSNMLRADKDQRKIGRELQINSLRRIIQDLQIGKNHKNILDRVDVLIKQAEEQIILSDDTINIEKLTDIKYELDLYKDMQKYFEIEGKPKISYEISQKQQLVIYMIDKIIDRSNNYTANAALNEGVPNILENEMAYTGAKRWFTETSAITKVRTVAFFDKLKRKAQGIAHQGKIKYYERLGTAMEGLKNEDIKKFFRKSADGKLQPYLISKYALKERLQEATDGAGHADMFELDVEAYEKGLADYTEILRDSLHFREPLEDDGTLSEQELENKNLQIDEYNDRQESKFQRKLAEWEDRYLQPFEVSNGKAVGVHWKYHKLHPDYEEFWQTEEFKDLAKNPKRLELYNVIQDINDDAYKLGLITYRNKFTHFPAILANSQEKVLAGETGVFSMQRFLDDLKASDQDEETITGGKVEINPITKKIIRTIPKLYQNRLGVKNTDGTYDYSKQSFNLAKVFGQYVNHIKEYEARQDLELQASLLMDLEARKSNVVVNGNKAIYQEDNEGNLIKEVTEGVNKNTGILEKAINRSVYGVTPFSDVKSTVKLFGKEINGVRVLRKLMAWRSMTSLGLNASSAAVTGIGGGLNMILEANRNGIYSKKDIANAITTLTQTTFRETKAMRVLKMLQSIDPIMDDLNEHRINQLSLTKFDQIVTSDNLFFMMRNVDKATQFVSGMAVMNNYMVKDGQLIEISKYVRNLNNFDAEFNRLTQAKEWNQLKQLENKVKADIEELKSKESVVSKEMAGEDSGITEEMQRELRPILQKYSKQILGNMSRDDVAQYKDTILGQLAGQFRGWMPRLAMQRFGGAEMDGVTGKLNWGKYLTLVNIFSKDILSLIKSTTGTLNDSSYDKILAKYNDLLQTHIDNGGTKDDFISLSEFKELYVNNLRSALKEVLMMISMTILAYSLTMAWDDDDKLNAAQKYTLLLLNRANNELTFYINPKSATELLKSPFPVISTLTDLQSFASHLNKETFNQIQQLATGDEEEDLKKAKPSKYLFKLFPVTKEMMNWGALLDDDFRKEFNINLGVR